MDLTGTDGESVQRMAKELDALRAYPESCADIVFADLYENKILFFLSTPTSTREAERQMTALLEQVGAWDGGATLTRCNGLDNTTQVRSAYLCHQDHLSNVRKIYPLRQ